MFAAAGAALVGPLDRAWAQGAVNEDLPVGEAAAEEHEPGFVLSPQGAMPQDPEAPRTLTVMGHEVVPRKGLYEVTSDMNVRAGPGTSYERLVNLKAGERVRAVGRVEGTDWLAVAKDGKDGKPLGFVSLPFLRPLLDGALAEPFFGSYASGDAATSIACDYRFRFERKSEVEGADFETSDYEIRFRCASQSGAASFYGQMFLTEGPVDEATGQHLIGLDVRSIGDGMEEYLTTTYLYHPKSGELTFQAHSLSKYANPPMVKKFKTKTIKEALRLALETAMGTWTTEAWAILFAPHE